jgi:predicted GNAT family acetyltransferase
MDSDLHVHHRAGAHGAFTVDRGSQNLGTLTYSREGKAITLIDTAIQDEIRGQGVGAALVQAAITFTGDTHLEVKVECPWATEYLQRHPDLLQG